VCSRTPVTSVALVALRYVGSNSARIVGQFVRPKNRYGADPRLAYMM
jgi:hypothetical protein